MGWEILQTAFVKRRFRKMDGKCHKRQMDGWEMNGRQMRGTANIGRRMSGRRTINGVLVHAG